MDPEPLGGRDPVEREVAGTADVDVRDLFAVTVSRMFSQITRASLEIDPMNIPL